MDQSTNKTVQSFWVALGSLSTFGLAIISSVILSRYINKDQYGTYRQIIFVYTTLLVVFTAGLPKVFAFFLPRYSLEEGKAIVKKITVFLFVCGIIFSLFLYLSSGLLAAVLDNPELSFGLKVFSPIPMFLLPTLGIEGIFSTYKKTIYIAIYNTLSRGFMLICIVCPVIIFKGTYINALYGWLAASIFILVLALFFKSIPFKKVENVRTELGLREILNYSFPLVGASIWGIAIKTSDTFYISRFFGEEAYAEYSNGFINLPFVTMITSSASVVLMPIFSKLFFEKSDYSEVLLVWRNTIKKTAILIYPFLIYFAVYANNFIVLLFTDTYAESAKYFRINLVLNFFAIIIFAPLFLSTGRTRLYARIHMFIAFFIWLSSFLVVQWFQTAVAVAWNSTIVNILKVLIFVSITSRILKIPFLRFFPLRQILLSLAQSVLAMIFTYYICSYVLNLDNLKIELFVSIMLFSSIILGTGRLIGLDYFEFIKPLLKKFIRKNRFS